MKVRISINNEEVYCEPFDEPKVTEEGTHYFFITAAPRPRNILVEVIVPTTVKA